MEISQGVFTSKATTKCTVKKKMQNNTKDKNRYSCRKEKKLVSNIGFNLFTRLSSAPYYIVSPQSESPHCDIVWCPQFILQAV